MLIHGNNLYELPKLADASIDAIITDPPYELGFMGKSWDSTGIAYNVKLWRECLRVLKPGGHLLAFSGSRTYHRMVVAIEDAGFEIRDQIMWVYGSGFPKSLDVSKAIDKQAGAPVKVGKAFKVAGEYGDRDLRDPETLGTDRDAMRHSAITDAAKQWEGWGTALKPAHEPIVLARKPLNGTVANNVLQHGTGALNINGCRVDGIPPTRAQPALRPNGQDSGHALGTGTGRNGKMSSATGRWPANLIHDGSDEVLELFPDSKGGAYPTKRGQAVATSFASGQETEGGYRAMGDSGSAARFFYCAKANKRDRNEGLDNFQPKREADRTADNGVGGNNPRNRTNTPKLNHHPTVKPTELMRYLCRLITPPGGTILDPFTGSGSTGKAAILEGFNFIGIELDPDYIKIAEARIDHAYTQRH